jgi:hypothetical protein
MSLPQSIAGLVSQAASHIDSQGELSIGYRARLHLAVEAESQVEHPRAGYYRRCKWELSAAACALPLWKQAGQSDDDLKDLLRLSCSALQSRVPLEKLLAARDTQWEQLLELGYQRPELQVISSAALATVAAATTVLHDIDLSNYADIQTGSNPENWEAAFYASVAIAGGATWNSEGESSLRRSFWLRQVGVTLSEVWPASVTPESVA